MELEETYNDPDMGGIGQIITMLAQMPSRQSNMIIMALWAALSDSEQGPYHRSILNAALRGDQAQAEAEIARFRADQVED